MNLEVEQYEGELKKLREWVKQYHGVNRPFICGGSGDPDRNGLRKVIFVCPALGADGFAIYEMKKEYDAPAY